MDNHGFHVIDMHHHYEPGFAVSDALDIGGGPGSGDEHDKARIELSTRLSTLDVEHVSGAVIIAGPTYLRPRGLADTVEVNNAIAAYRNRVPDRFLASVGVIEPLYGPAAYGEAARCRDELGMCGISFHNAYQSVPIDSPLMRPLIQKIGEAGLVPFIHAIGSPLETIWQVDALAKDFPDLPMVVLDVFYDVNSFKSLPAIAERRPNLTFDLALMVSFECQGLPTVRAVGADRFVYGTDQYSWPLMTKPFGSLLPRILESDLSDADKTAIFSGNIKRILGI
jgi:predicted TIM-barrel fold metal-dependent hydrolase